MVSTEVTKKVVTKVAIETAKAGVLAMTEAGEGKRTYHRCHTDQF